MTWPQGIQRLVVDVPYHKIAYTEVKILSILPLAIRSFIALLLEEGKSIFLSERNYEKREGKKFDNAKRNRRNVRCFHIDYF